MRTRDYGITFTLLVSAHISARFVYERFITQQNLSTVGYKMMPWISFIILAVVTSAIFLGLIHFGVRPAILWLADVRAKSRVKTFDSVKEDLKKEVIDYERRVYKLYNEQKMHISSMAIHYKTMGIMANELSERVSALDNKEKIKFPEGFTEVWAGETMVNIKEWMEKTEERLKKLEGKRQ